ncbi:MAG: UdgX family uracil-DNA binding protein [Anaerolineae bacterium]|nr:UdgX family uracil-DNA binding protein [Gemmatimonadaceae bacterium]
MAVGSTRKPAGAIRREVARSRGRNGSAAVLIPERPTLPKLRAVAAGCRACHLWKCGTQTVFGEGTQRAEVMFVGEQPGDREDLEGRPFVGPAGRLFDVALDEAGIDRKKVYVTNVVKHFKWERGEKSKRRIHKKPNDTEIAACYPWLNAEIEVVKPAIIVCLGAVAAQAMLGKSFRVTRDRGKAMKSSSGALVLATVHPSSILRVPGSEDRELARREFVADVSKIKRFLR